MQTPFGSSHAMVVASIPRSLGRCRARPETLPGLEGPHQPFGVLVARRLEGAAVLFLVFGVAKAWAPSPQVESAALARPAPIRYKATPSDSRSRTDERSRREMAVGALDRSVELGPRVGQGDHPPRLQPAPDPSTADPLSARRAGGAAGVDQP